VPAVDIGARRIVIDPAPLAAESGEAEPSPDAGHLPPTAVGSRRQRSTLSRKGRG